MPLHPTLRRLTPLFVVVALLVAGCSKRKDPGDLELVPDLTERDADDFAQQIAANMASNNGGWWFTIEKTCGIIDAFFPVPIPPPGAGVAPRNDSPFRTFSDTTFTIGQMEYTMELRYISLNESPDAPGRVAPDTSTDQIAAQVTTSFSGGRINNALAGTETTFGFITNLDDTTNFGVLNLYPLADTLEFSGTISDSAFSVVTSKFHTATGGGPEARVWYHYDDFFDYTLYVLKSDLPNARVIDGEVNWLIAARGMPDNSGDRTVQVEDKLASAHMSFDGTNIATLRINDSLELIEFRYSIDLKTGNVIKLP